MQGSHSALPDRVGNVHVKMGVSNRKKESIATIVLAVIPTVAFKMI
jgi:hypothetical protein